jgi:hypothetical protein
VDSQEIGEGDVPRFVCQFDRVTFRFCDVQIQRSSGRLVPGWCLSGGRRSSHRRDQSRSSSRPLLPSIVIR